MFHHGTADFDGYYQELVRAAIVTPLLHASVVDLATGADPGWVDRVEVRRKDGAVLVRARLVVLAAGGIESPRLLLLSRRAHRGSATGPGGTVLL